MPACSCATTSHPAPARRSTFIFPIRGGKNRHHNRRLFTPEFVAQCVRVLRSAGRLHLATDVDESFRVMTDVVATQVSLGPLPPQEAHEPAHDLDYLTNFERKFRKEGKAIYRQSYEKQ